MPNVQSRSTLSPYTIICSLLMQAGVVTMLVALSFSALWQHLIFVAGIILLFIGFSCGMLPLLWQQLCRARAGEHSEVVLPASGECIDNEAPGIDEPGASLITDQDIDVL